MTRHLALLTTLVAASAAMAAADPLDWTYCRGPEFNGVSRETGLVDDFDPKGGEDSNVAWKRADLGGRSTPIVMNGRLYTLCRAEPGTAREGERVVCVDAKTGEDIWENRFNVYLSDVPDTRVGWSAVVGDPETDRVYAQGVCGHFQCIDGATGETIWAIPLHERFGLLSTYGGRTNFPIICDDLVIVSAIVIGWGEQAKPAHRFIGFDKLTGEVVWFNGTRPLPYDTTYSPPSLAVINGEKMLIFGSGDGAIWALQPRTGEHIWQFPISRRGVNAAPLVMGGTVYASHSEENIVGTAMGALVAINAEAGKGDIASPAETWRVNELMAGKTQPLPVGDNIWVFDDRAKLHIFNASSGERVGRRINLGTQMRANPLYADGKVYAFTANGRWAILEPDPQRGAKILKRGRLASGEGTNGSPICSHGRIYLQTSDAVYCLFDARKTQAAEPIPPEQPEAPVETDTTPVHLQVVPAEILIRPGQQQQFTAKLFNARGQLLRSVEAEFALDGPGEITADGSFTAPDAGHVATYVKASSDGLTGSARIRVVPSLPWSFDFDDVPLAPATKLGEPPITWVGARYRHVVREVDGSQAIVKITTIPKGTRSRSWMGHSDLHDYTIQADVMGAVNDTKLPDIGLIAQGYTLDLQGAVQKLEIRTWVPQRRIAQAVDYSWEPNRWYTLKLRASLEDGQALLQGKIWARGTPEPSEWTVQTTDSSPNLSGSPGLYGNAKDAELYLDNIKVTAN